MEYDIQIGDWRIGMLDAVEIHSSVELLADTATITLPGAEYNLALDVEEKLHRGDRVTISLGYAEVGMETEFTGFVQRIGTDDGTITIDCEDDLFKFRVPIQNRVLKNITLKELLTSVITDAGLSYDVDSTYDWTYERFVINTATAFDVLKKVQEESGANIYLQNGVLHLHAPAENVGKNVIYDFSQNVQKCDLQYRKASDRRVRVVVKALLPDGSVKVREYGTLGGDSVEIKSAAADDTSMAQRGEAEHLRLSYDGYEGNITTWLVPHIQAGDSAELFDADYEYKNGRYFVQSVTTTFGKDGATRKIELGFKLN